MRERRYKSVVQSIAAMCLAIFYSAGLHAQSAVITIRLINGKNGKPIKDENLNVFRNRSLFAENFRADANGLIQLTIDRDAVVSFLSNIQVTCHEMTASEKANRELKQYEVRDILAHGISDTNTCSKTVRIEAKPGEFVYFERPRTFLEGMAL